MPKSLVTGGAGFIGSNLVEHLLKKGHQVIAVDDLSTGSIKNLPTHKNLRFIKADANNADDIGQVFLTSKVDYVFHYAAVVGVKRTLENPVSVLDDIDGFKNIFGLAKNTGVKRVFFSSSSEVYGEPVEFPQKEDTTPLNSRLPYAVVKNLGEAFLRSYKKEFGLDFTIFRFFNTYGPKQSVDFVMSKFIKAALNNEDITVYGDGSQTRTFCYVDDNVEATVNAIDDKTTISQVLNIGSENEVPIKELAELIIKATNSNSKVVHLPPLKEGDMTRRQPDVSRMKGLLNRSLTPLETGIKKLIAHNKLNLAN